jgi:hypothetical protein
MKTFNYEKKILQLQTGVYLNTIIKPLSALLLTDKKPAFAF